MYHYFQKVMLSKKTYKNQITLPKEALRHFPEAEYFDVAVEENGIFLRPVQIKMHSPLLKQIRHKMHRLGITRDDIHDAITWAGRKK